MTEQELEGPSYGADISETIEWTEDTVTVVEEEEEKQQVKQEQSKLELPQILSDLLGQINTVESGEDPITTEVGSPTISPTVQRTPSFVYSKYLKTAKVPGVLKDILEEENMYDYNAHIQSISQHECENCGVTKFVNIRGGKYNPFVQYQNRRSSASKTTKKLQNVAKDFTMVKMVLTLPKEISEELVKNHDLPKCGLKPLQGARLDKSFFAERQFDIKEAGAYDLDDISKFWEAFNVFKEKLTEQKAPGDKRLGMSVSPHVWSSSKPWEPHCHFHIDMPMFRCDYPSKKRLKFFNLGNIRKVRQFRQTEDKYKELQEEIDRLEEKLEESEEELPATTKKLENKKDQLPKTREKYEKLSEELNQELLNCLGVEEIPRTENDQGAKVPLYEGNIKKLWSEAVTEVFGTQEVGLKPLEGAEIVTHEYDDLVVDLSHYASDEKGKMLHDLSYRSRTPISDVALSLTEHDVKTSNGVDQWDKLENEQQIINNKEWIKELIGYDNGTRVFGYWTAMKQLIGYGEKEQEDLCYLCGGSLVTLNGCTEKSEELSGDVTFINKSGRKIRIYKVKTSPPDSEDQQRASKGDMDRCRNKPDSQKVKEAIQGTADRQDLVEKFDEDLVEDMLHKGMLFEPRPGIIKVV